RTRVDQIAESEKCGAGCAGYSIRQDVAKRASIEEGTMTTMTTRRKFLTATAGLALASAAGRARAADPLKIGVAYVSPIAEIGWTKQHSLGVDAIRKKFGDKVQITVLDNIFQPQDAERVF